MRAITRLDPATAAPRAAGERGFTFIEVLISLLLVAIAAAAGISLLVSTVRATAYAGCSQVATRLAQEIIDRAMVEPYTTLGATGSICDPAVPLGPVYATAGGAASDGGQSVGNMTLYSRRCTVAANNSVAYVTVQVAWSESGAFTYDGAVGDNRPHYVTLGVVRAP